MKEPSLRSDRMNENTCEVRLQKHFVIAYEASPVRPCESSSTSLHADSARIVVVVCERVKKLGWQLAYYELALAAPLEKPQVSKHLLLLIYYYPTYYPTRVNSELLGLFFLPICWGPAPTGTGTIALDPTFGSFYRIKNRFHIRCELVSLVKVFRLFRLERTFFFCCSECGHSR
jgi:hypothetical protein